MQKSTVCLGFVLNKLSLTDCLSAMEEAQSDLKAVRLLWRK